MEWFLVISLLLIGILLILAEIIFIPGTTVVGIIGFCVAGFGIYLCYAKFGTNAGTIALLISCFVTGILFIVAVKSGIWDKISLNKVNEGKVNAEFEIDLQVNQKGKAISSLRPVGKAEFNDIEYEVSTFGDYVEAGKEIKIISIKGRKITVEPIN